MNKKINSYSKASYESPLLEALNVGKDFETVLCDSEGSISDYNYQEQELW